ncbi:protein of unknown function [Taphrina deformans PYCC 5710]|uniref:Ketoreductase domain-containing protein n=1 Tax=Taphrina deformans (strain PYCC 5710 / ATCC 11124 / CBS 356.35 / IMI 108563 / JCM 9778 / NBRC 8474) TaxID=1097556 RepID=R4XDD3_TAPDE|nr:protein of unknown function [Taphrina deformans PYCC 5710]|eukprot:CCG83840.1 protein of unknown function [Taphrina deformans PYCC 5710]
MAASRLQGRTVLITGASSGIGKATAEEFVHQAREGDIKLVLAARRIDTLNQIKADLEGKGAKVHTIKLDVGNLAEIQSAIRSLPQQFSKIDVLLNNAGFVLGNDKVGSIEPSEVAGMMSVNVLGLINMTQEVIKVFEANGGRGDIVNIGSIAGREPYAGGSIYCASKAAVAAFTSSLRKELVASAIRVIQVDPGQVETEFSVVRMRGDKAKADAIYKGVTPLTPQDIAEIIVFAVGRPENVVIADTLVFPSHQAGAGVMHRRES